MAEEMNRVIIDASEYRDLVVDSCMNYRRGQVIELIGNTIKRNLEGKESIRAKYSKYGIAVKDPDTVIDCILTILEIVDNWTFCRIMNGRHDSVDRLPEEEEAQEDIILPDLEEA